MNQQKKIINYGPSLEPSTIAQNWLSKNKRQFGHFINGEMIKSQSVLKSTNPANGEFLANVSVGSSVEINLAIKSAKKAFKIWSATPPFERAKFIYSLARLVQKNSRLLAVLETLDNGKPIRETRDIDVPLVARHFYHHAGWARILQDEFPNKKPLGVIGQIIPWNFPLLMLAWKIAPAIATGNTVILKPAETTPLTALFFAELCKEAKIPPGVINIVTGDGETGAILAGESSLAKIAFTGSTEIGKKLRRQTAGKCQSLTLELGGKSAFIVFEDADLDSAIEGVVDSIWFNQGEVCCAGSRLLVQESVQKKFIAKLKRRMTKLRVGDPLDKSTDIGAINSKEQLEKIKALVLMGAKEGAEIFQPEMKLPNTGFFYPPTLLENSHQSMEICQTEIFGPVLSVIPFRTPVEAISIANNSKYGLSGSIWTENINLGLDIAPRIKAGVIWVNSTNLFDASAGFGGYRESGYGREGGIEGLVEYLKNYEKPIRSSKPKMKKRSRPKKGQKDFPTEIDRTRKLFIGGKQKRSDSGYTYKIYAPNKTLLGQVPDGNRKDVRDAVEAASLESKWSSYDHHTRAQILYYAAENLKLREKEFVFNFEEMTGEDGKQEFENTLSSIFYFAAWADKFEGKVHNVPIRGISLAMKEPIGVIGIVCPDENPLLSYVNLTFGALATGNRVVIVPSEKYPLSALDTYQIFETSDMPDGAINIVTGKKSDLCQTLTTHMAVDCLWYFGNSSGSKLVEELSTSNLKQTWVSNGEKIDWSNLTKNFKMSILEKSTQTKNIWIPYGE